jgi:glutamate racemase
MHAKGISVIEKEGRGLVELIEAGSWSSAETKTLLKEYLQPMLEARIDHLVLGCTHYPYLQPLLRELLPESIAIIDCGEAVARQTRNVLKKFGILNSRASTGRHSFYTNGDLEILKSFIADAPSDSTVEFLDF